MIDRVQFENFKSLKSVRLDLSPLTVLVGPNGCGKSTVLQAIHLASQCGIARRHEENDPWWRFGTTFVGPRDPRRLATPPRPTTIRLQLSERGGDQLLLQISVPGGDEDDTP